MSLGKTISLAREDAKMVWYLLFNSSLVYFVNLTNFLVTKNTSALTLQECIQVFQFIFSALSSEISHICYSYMKMNVNTLLVITGFRNC